MEAVSYRKLKVRLVKLVNLFHPLVGLKTDSNLWVKPSPRLIDSPVRHGASSLRSLGAIFRSELNFIWPDTNRLWRVLNLGSELANLNQVE
jgi:hypothetical protein